ncbi:organic hydroperoxide resistance protein [Aquimarina hainanensis]|uniref:Organic hydroperoxide resistance protein n=1 Tax=Aquimarina hainanensis TaxID=1578017 RepID=A0ABW5N2P4_9FLAO|nr:organic hydroperoxide resistance protein [Aquimarina sp. TRL1]QKX05920.1 organic hydroperoxide resistance protein [Aquimarina sp. TRL1]
MKILYTAEATTEKGRSGHVSTDTKTIDTPLSVPKELGGAGGDYTNPEELFAAGYSACYGSALQHIADQRKIDLGDFTVTAVVSIGKTEEEEFELAVVLDTYLPGIETALAEELINEAHEVCPYSRATRDNIDVTLNLLLDE